MTAASPPMPQGTVTFLFTDIEGSTDLARRLGADFGSLRAEHRRVLREAFSAHDGHEIDTAGDGFFIAFERARDAIGAALAAQRAVAGLQEPLRVRMGLHTAEPHVSEGGYVGVGVNRAARVCAAGHGGQILLSAATAGILEDLNLEGVNLRDLGEHRLKDLLRPQRVFQLEVQGLPSQFPPLNTLSGANVLGTLLRTDLTGWTALLRVLGDEAALTAASRYHTIIERAVETHGGSAVELVADHGIAFFERPRDALRAALAVRDAVRHDPWVSDERHRCALRCGIHSARIVSVQPGQLGSAAPYVIRLCDTAEPWQILVSHATEALLEGDAPEFELEDLGERTLAGRDRSDRVFGLPA